MTDFEPTSQMKRRLIYVVLSVNFAAAVALIIGLGKLMITDHQIYAEKANSTHFTNRTITASRGTIYDAKGTPLAWSATVYKVYIDPVQFRKDLDSIEEVMEKRRKLAEEGKLSEGKRIATRQEIEDEIVDLLSTKLKISQDAVLTAMEKESQFEVLQTQVDKATADELMEYFSGIGMEAVSTQQDSKRYYPQNELAAQVIGFTNSDGNGQYGLEAYYDEYLAGVNGRTTTAKDAQGNIMPYRNATTYPAQDGASIYLTLDTTLQYCLEKNLEEMSTKFEVGNRSCGIIMNAKTGAIYAMATYPSFDLNNPSVITDEKVNAELQALPAEEYQEAYIAAREKQWKNKAISEALVPGSVFKIFTATAAIEEQAVDLETYSFYCDGIYEIGDDKIGCHDLSGHGTESFQQALIDSCNPTFIDIGRKLGIHKFCTYFSAFGLTEKTGIDLPGETSSIYREEESMSIVDLATSAFGQSNSLTPIEEITGIAAAVNGGYLVQPHVVDKIVSSDGNIVKTFGTNIRRQVVSEETSAKMQELLQGVVDAKEGANAHIDGYKIGGKSGTAQKYVNGRVSDEYYIASYACFAPADDPEIVILISADEPNKEIEYYGSKVAAPYARKIMEEALPYLGFYPEYTEEQLAKLDITVPSLMDKEVTAAAETLEELGLKYTVVGEGELIVGQCPATGSSVSRDGTVVLYTEENYKPEMIEVPDVTHYAASDANAKLTELGLNYVSVGDTSLLVSEQSIEPGTMVEPGTVVMLTYLVSSQAG